MAYLQSSSIQGVTFGTNWVGMIMAFAKSATPTDWLTCDGSTVSRSTYADLFSVIGTTWGAGDGNTTFSVPDMRGEFQRGVPGGSSREPDNQNRAVGSHVSQQWAQGNPNYCVQSQIHTGGGQVAPAPGWATMQFKHPGYPDAHGGNPPNGTLARSLGFYHDNDGAGYNSHRIGYGAQAENAPRNIAVHYCIKF